MRTKKRGLAAVLFLYLSAAALIFLLGLAANEALGRFGRNALLLAEPSSQGGGVSINEIEEFIDENRMLVTYEIRRQAQVSAVRQNRAVTVIGTNGAYAAVMGYPAADGGFFTESAYKTGSREAVLNELAAASLFGGGRVSGGTLFLDGETWNVTGVIIDDGGAECIYIPATNDYFSSSNGTAGSYGTAGAANAAGQSVFADSLMVLLKNHGASEAAVAINTLRGLGINENTYTFKRIGKAAAAIGEMADVARMLALTFLFLLFAWRSARAARRIFNRAKAVEKAADINAVPAVTRRRAGYVKAVAYIVFMVVCMAAPFIFGRRIIEICVTWQEIPLIFLSTPARQGAFFGRLESLGGLQAYATGLFAASSAVSAAAQIAAAYVFGD